MGDRFEVPDFLEYKRKTPNKMSLTGRKPRRNGGRSTILASNFVATSSTINSISTNSIQRNIATCGNGLESTHIQHYPESLMTEDLDDNNLFQSAIGHLPPVEFQNAPNFHDMTEDLTAYYTAESSSEDEENIPPTNIINKHLLFSGKKQRKSELFRNKPVLASDSDSDDERANVMINKRRSILGNHEVILISSESDENDELIHMKTPVKSNNNADELSESRMGKVEHWLATSPIPPSPATPARIILSDSNSSTQSDDENLSFDDGKTSEISIPSSEATSKHFFPSIMSEATSKGLNPTSTMETIVEEEMSENEEGVKRRSISVQVEMTSSEEESPIKPPVVSPPSSKNFTRTDKSIQVELNSSSDSEAEEKSSDESIQILDHVSKVNESLNKSFNTEISSGKSHGSSTDSESEAEKYLDDSNPQIEESDTEILTRKSPPRQTVINQDSSQLSDEFNNLEIENSRSPLKNKSKSPENVENPSKKNSDSDTDSDSEFKNFLASLRKKYEFDKQKSDEKLKKQQEDMSNFIVPDDHVSPETSGDEDIDKEEDNRPPSSSIRLRLSDSDDEKSPEEVKKSKPPQGSKNSPKEIIVISDDSDYDLPTPKSLPPKKIRHVASPPSKKLPLMLNNSGIKNKSGDNNQLSFLMSLTVDIPLEKRHPNSIKFTRRFAHHKLELTAKLYKLFNDEAFEGLLPANMDITWNPRLTKTAGMCVQRCRYKGTDKSKILDRSSRIELSSKVLDSADRLRDTLIHEMCHAAAWVISGYRDGHGPIWKSWAQRAMNRFPELPIIDRCHNYTIRTKYTYRCVKCGYSIGRHSKSLDTERK